MEINRKNRIYQEFLRIGSYFEKLEEDQSAIIFPLIKNAAFMRVTLDDLQEIIAEQGCVEQYQNGMNQSGMKQSAALQSYNALIKNYAAIIKTLFDKLPRDKKISAAEEWRRAKLTDKEYKATLAAEKKEREKASALWLEKLKSEFDNLYDSE